MKDSNDKISIIVPVYNTKEYISTCIDSLLAQSYENIEIVLIDDCSTDGSSHIAQSYADEFPKICKYFRNKKNLGVSASRNLGLKYCTGMWVAFVDSDDWIDKNYINVLLNIALEQNADLVISGCLYAWEGGKLERVPDPPFPENCSVGDYVAYTRIGMNGKLIKKRLFTFHNILFPQGISRLEELSVVVPLLTYAEQIKFVTYSGYYYRQHSVSASNQNSPDTDIEEFWKSVERMYQNADLKYEAALEYHAICELLYSAIIVMIRGHKPKREIELHITRFLTKYPEWKNNCYFYGLRRGKKIFVKLASTKKIFILKIITRLWDTKQYLFQKCE